MKVVSSLVVTSAPRGLAYAVPYGLRQVSTDPTTGFTRDMAVDFARRTTLAVGLKLEWQQRVRAAYHAQDKGAMKLLVGVSIQEVQAAVHSLWKLHRSRWLESYKPFGLEVRASTQLGLTGRAGRLGGGAGSGVDKSAGSGARAPTHVRRLPFRDGG